MYLKILHKFTVGLLAFATCLTLAAIYAKTAEAAKVTQKTCPEPKNTEPASLQSRTFKSPNGITFELPKNYRVASAEKDTLIVLDDEAYKHVQCIFKNKIPIDYYVDSIHIYFAYDRETYLNVVKSYNPQIVEYGQHKFLVYKSEGETSQINAMTYDELNHRLVIIYAYLGEGNNIVMEPAFYQILSTLKF